MFDRALPEDVGDVLREAIGRRYGLEVEVSAPKPMVDGKPRAVNRWWARVVTRPSGSTARIGVQRIKIEIDDREPTPRSAPLPMFRHHDRLAGHYEFLLVRSEPPQDICSDKLVAFPMSVAERRNPRYRDVWDVLWIVQQSRNVDAIMRATRSKAESRGLGDGFHQALDGAAERMDEIVNSDAFHVTLRRFLPAPTADRTIGNPDYRKYMASA